MAEIFTQFAVQLSSTSSQGKGAKVSVEISSKDIPQSVRTDRKLVGEITARKGDNYTLTLKTGETIDLKITPAVPIGTRFVAQLDAQGKPVQGELIPPQTTVRQGRATEGNPSTPQSQTMPTAPKAQMASSGAQTSHPTPSVASDGFIDVKQLQQNTPLPKGTVLQIVQEAVTQQLPAGKPVDVMVHVPVNSKQPHQTVLQNTSSVVVKGVPLPPTGAQLAEVNVTPQAVKSIILSIPQQSLPKPIQGNSQMAIQQALPLQTLTLSVAADGKTAQVIQAKPFTENISIKPVVPQHIPTLKTPMPEASVRAFIETARIESLPTKLPEGAQFTAKVVDAVVSQTVTAGQRGSSQQLLPPTVLLQKPVTQTLMLPSGQAVTVQSKMPLPEGALVQMQVFSNNRPQIMQVGLPTAIEGSTGVKGTQSFVDVKQGQKNHNVFNFAKAHEAFKLPETFTATLTSRVSGNTFEAVLSSGQQTRLELPQQMPVGSSIKVATSQGSPSTLILTHVQLPLEAGNEAVIIQKFNHQWETLQKALGELRGQQQISAKSLTENIPEIQRNIIATLPFFAQAVLDETAEKWLGQETINLLKALGVDLSADVSQLNQLASKSESPDSWRALFFPYQGEHEDLKQGGFYWKKQSDDQPESRHVRFIVESSLSHLGAFQIDGLMHGKDVHIKIRTTKLWDEELNKGLITVTEQTLESLGYTSSIFVEANKGFEKSHLIAMIESTARMNISV